MKYQLPLPAKLKAFTLAEVLITLVIIGVIAAITVPSLLQSSQDKEFHSKFKKNFSVLQNSLRRAQVEEGTIGDNTVVFSPQGGSGRHYESAKRFAKYVNTIKVCENSNDTDCDGVYYPIKYATQRDDIENMDYMSAIVLADGSIYKINQYESCAEVMDDCEQDENGLCIEDENGDTTEKNWSRSFCAEIYVDVNGAKKPNKMGKDTFVFRVYQDRVNVANWEPFASKKSKDILINRI